MPIEYTAPGVFLTNHVDMIDRAWDRAAESLGAIALLRQLGEPWPTVGSDVALAHARTSMCDARAALNLARGHDADTLNPATGMTGGGPARVPEPRPAAFVGWRDRSWRHPA